MGAQTFFWIDKERKLQRKSKVVLISVVSTHHLRSSIQWLLLRDELPARRDLQMVLQEDFFGIEI